MACLHQFENGVCRGCGQQEQRIAYQTFANIQNNLGLHRHLEVIYVVDGYSAWITSDDGAVHIETESEPTILEALEALERLLA